MEIVKESGDTVEKVLLLMVILNQLILAAKLREQKNLRAKPSCPSRCGSYFSNLKRYMQLKDHTSKIDIEAVEESLPIVRKRIESFKKLSSNLPS